MNKKNEIFKLLFGDLLTSQVVFWLLLNLYNGSLFFENSSVYIIFFSLCWSLCVVGAYSFFVLYENILRKSRLAELIIIAEAHIFIFLFVTFVFIFSFSDFFILNLDKFIPLLIFHAVFSIILRIIFISHTQYKIRKGKYFIPTIVIGDKSEVIKIFSIFQRRNFSSGNQFIGCILFNNEEPAESIHELKVLGQLECLESLIDIYKIEEIIIGVDITSHQKVIPVLCKLLRTNISIKVLPETKDFFTGVVKLHSLNDEPFVILSYKYSHIWQNKFKRLFDVVVAVMVLILFSPLFALIAVLVKFSSKGSIIFSQERIGIGGNPFTMYKFRSMYINAEVNGPELSSSFDPRITALGRFLRKSRLDEIPQFFNVLIGNMSIVGPRPERQFYIEQIAAKAPHYYLLHKVKPGITSWGQVKFGYAENVDEMLERLKYDIVYIESSSFYSDLKILFYTIGIILKGGGK